MKIPISVLILLALVTNSLRAQSPTTQSQVNVPEPTPYAIVSQDANSQVWQRKEYEAGPNGQIITHVRSYKEIASGLNYLDANSNYQPSQETIELQPDGTAAALQGQHKAFFPIDISNGRITLVTPEGLQVSSEPLELSYFDGTNTVVLAELTNSIGVLVGNNQVVYPNAFAGLTADIRYTYTRAGLEQDVILRQQPATPESYNLISESARLQMVTEFFTSPNPTATTTALPQQAGISLEDQSIGFGTMQMVLGHAFLLGQSAAEPGALVAKSWLVVNGDQFLVEEIPVNAIVDGLAALPLTAMNTSSSKASYLASRRVVLPRHRPERKSNGKIMLAKGQLPANGFVLDYQTVNGSLTNTTYQCDNTYYVSGLLYSFGTNVFEGGAVIKYTNNGAIVINPGMGTPSISFKGSSYRPVVFTSKDDNSIGASINGATGNPSSGYYGTMLDLGGFSPATALANFRMSYANNGIFFDGANANVYNAQFVHCFYALNFAGSSVGLRNTLFANNATNLLLGGDTSVNAQNSTFSGSTNVAAGPSYPEGVSITLTNCILCNNSSLTNGVIALNGAHNGFYDTQEFGSGNTTNNFYPFQTVGDGSYYYTDGCAFTNAGTVNIDPTLLAELDQLTVYPPVVYSNNVITNTLVLVPLVTRDTNGNPALGFHYYPLDYVFGGSDLYSNVTVAAGTALGYFDALGHVSSSGQPYGFSLNSGSSFTTTGTATAPCWVVDYTDVQEGTGGWSDSGWMGAIMLNGNGSGATPQINSTFTKWGKPSTLFFRDNSDHGEGTFANCEFYAGSCATYDSTFIYFTNCLFDREAFYCYDQDAAITFSMQNCTFNGGLLVLVRTSGQAPAFWNIENTSFDGAGFFFNDNLNGSNSETLFNYNAYNTNNLSGLSYSFPYGNPTNVLEVVGPNDKKISGYNWQNSWFGDFYLPTNSQLIRAGSTNANLLGLYHYTTQTNQVVEKTNIVTIGYHYVATDTNGDPLSTPNDGMPDYLADANGNGIDDSGETPWDIAIISQPQSTNVAQGQSATFSVVPSGIGPFTYQWLQNSNAISQANGASYTCMVAQPSQDGYTYSVVVSNADGRVSSSNAILHVTTPLSITGGPSSATVAQGSTAQFSITTTGNYLVYQWYSNSVPLNSGGRFSGVTTNTLTISGVSPSDAAGYSVVVTNLFGSVSSGPASLIVVTNPWILSSSMTTNAIQSQDATFSVAANGAQFYQWWFSNSIINANIPGASGPNYTQLVVQTNNAGFYSVIITNLAGSTNVGANLTVLVPPWITTQPTNLTVNQGSTAAFSVTATGTTNLYYQWFNDGTNAISGATGSSLTLNNVQPTNAAGYSCLVSNIAGTNMSVWAWLSVISTGGSTNYGWGTNGNTAFIPPVVSMLSPTNSSPTNPGIYPYGTPISIRALAQSQYGYITNVAFYFTGTNSGPGTNFMLAGTAVPGPNTQFALAWTNMLPGTNILEARAWDFNGNTTNSGLVYVIMSVPPSISVGPNTNIVWTEGASGTNIQMAGSIMNDGQPNSYITNIQWSVVNGNGQYVSIANSNSLTTQVTFSTNGVFQLQLQVGNGYASTNKSCTIKIIRHPQITFISPINGSNYLTGSPLVLKVTAVPYDGTITNVTYYTNTGVLGAGVQSLNNTWVCDWQIPPLWANTVAAVAADDDGLCSTASVSIAVLPILAVQILSPTNQTFIAQTNVTITAQALYAPGSETVDWVEFFDGTNSLGYAYSSNNIFQVNWIPLIGGTNVLTALALNTNGNSAMSVPVTNYVRSLPTVELTSPANGQIFTIPGTNITISASAAAYGTTTVSQVIFYDGTNSLYTNTTGAPYTLSWANVTNGIYTLYAQAIDSLGESGYSTNIMIAVLATNQPPSVYAGPDQVVNLAITNSANLHGLVLDDGLPYGSALAVTWTNLSGPASVLFSNSSNAVTAVTFTTTGQYELELSANDSQFITTNDLTVTVISNQPPVVYAGPDEIITNQDVFQLQGCAADDGLPYGTLVVNWTVISSPNQVTFANPNLTNTVVILSSGFNAGVYHFRLTASDGQLITFSDVYITNSNAGSISYEEPGYRYLMLTNAAPLTNTSLGTFYMTNFDDSLFSIGPAGFGNKAEGRCFFAYSNYVKTYWPGSNGTNYAVPYILLRHFFTVPTNTSDLSMGFTVDNDCSIYLNGVLITTNNVTQVIYNDFQHGGEGFATNVSPDLNIPGFVHGGCASYEDLVLNAIQTNLWHSGSNLLAVLAYDGGDESVVDCRVSYGPIEITNHAPVINLEGDQIVETNTPLQLPGEVLDDGLPNNGLHTAAWSVVSGPGNVTFGQTNYSFITAVSFTNTASFDTPGVYVLQLVANDSQLSTTGQISVLAWAEPASNQGTNQGSSITLAINLTQPANLVPYILGSTIPIAATASPTGAIVKVEFFASLASGNNVLVGELPASPYSVNWVPAVGGLYTITAMAIPTNADYPPATSTLNVEVSTPLPPNPQDDTYFVLPNSTNNIFYALGNDTDPNNSPLVMFALSSLVDTNNSITTINGGTATIINDGLAISYSPPPGVYGSDGFYYWVSNDLGGMAEAGITINIAGESLPAVTLTAANSSTNAGAIDPLMATVTNSQDIAFVSFYEGITLLATVTNGVGGIYTYNWQATDDGYGDSFTAQETDIYGQVSTSPVISINVTTNGLNGVLDAELDSIIDAQGTNFLSTTNLVTIRDGLFRLYGKAYHSLGSNVVWQLGVYSIDGTLIKNLASGSNSVTSTSSPLVNCDLTTLINGVYALQLTVTGGFQTTETSIDFRLESNLKIGEFSFSQQDMVIPVNNIPLSVTRTYNSINPNKGDFGYGWTYALNSMSVSLDETRQQATDVGDDSDGDETFSERSGGSCDVTLTLPNGQTTTFYFSLVPANEDGQYLPQWIAAPGVTATLTTQDNAILTDFGGFYYLAVPTWTSGTSESQDVPMDNFDFANFVLQTEDGTKYLISREDLGEHDVISEGQSCHVHAYGQPYLSEIIERDNDTISISPNAIVFQATNGASRQITFQRNADGLITSVSDPNAQTNNGPPTVQYQYDSQDNLVSVLNLVDPSIPTYVTNYFSYTNTAFPHYITGIIDANGNQVAKNFYDSSGKLIAVQDANGNLTQFIHNLTNNSEILIDRLGYTNTYVYDSFGNVIAQTNQLGQVTQMAYDANNNKTNEVAFLNNQPYSTNSYSYDPNLNVMLSSTDPLGHTSTYAYDTNGDLLVSTDANHNGSTNVYDGNGNLIISIDALGHGTTNVYADGLLVSSQNAIGTIAVNTYDDYENVAGTATLDASNKILSTNSFAYDANGNRTNSTAWRLVNGAWTSAVTQYVYDAKNRVIQTVDPDGGVTQTTYDNNGNPVVTQDQNYVYTFSAYDSENRLLQSSNRDVYNNVILISTSSYDANGNWTNSIDGDGNATTYVYDALNRLASTVFADGSSNTTVYDGVGRVAKTIDASGTITAFGYDAAGRRLAVTNALGTVVANASFYSYDPNGNQITFTDADNHTTTNIYDSLNRQVQTQYPDGSSVSTGYDLVGNRIVATNQYGKATWFAYDGSGRLIAVTNSLNQVTRYQYDEMGNETAQIDALNRTNAYAYDGQGRRVAHWLPNTNLVEQFSYDGAGNMTSQTNFNGNILTKAYDGLNRLKGVSGLDSSQYSVNYLYSAGGNRTNMAGTTLNILHRYDYFYDNRHRIIQKHITQLNGNANLLVLNYAYDLNGNLTNLWTSDGAVNIMYAYDPLNRLTNVVDSASGASGGYAYDHVGNLQGMVYGNGVTNAYQYDSLNRLTNLVWQYGSAARAKFEYQVDFTGNRTNLIETVNTASQTNAWSFDSIYRLTNEVAGALGRLSYQYDPVGNRTTRTSTVSGLTNQILSFNTNDWLTSDQYDADGNTTNSLNNVYQYDPADELTNFNNAISMIYDGDGNRIYKLSAGTKTYYVVDNHNPSGYPQVLEEMVDSGTGPQPSKTYVYGINLLSQRPLSGGVPGVISYYGFDGHGSVRFLMDTSGTITDAYTYDAFGGVIKQTGASTPNNYLYCGQQFDPDLGLYYNRARYLNPNTGRFWSMDSYAGNNEDPLSLHKYLYGGDNPVNRIDPSGHDDLSLGSVLAGSSIGAGIDGAFAGVTTRAFSWAAFRTITAAIAIGAEIGGDRGGSQMLFHYDTLPEFQVTGFPTGTWLTDRGDLPFAEALGITYQSGSRLFVYAVAIKSPTEIEPFPPIRPGVNQWRTTGYLPPIRIGIIKTLYGPNWTGPTE